MHEHSHAGHSHGESSSDYSKIFVFGILLNTLFIVLEAVYGIIINSLALIADAGHNLSDVFGLLIAWGASYLVKKTPTLNRTYGFRKSSILAALFNAIILLIAVGAIGIEAIKRLGSPAPTEGTVIVWVASAGIVINALTAWLFHRDSKKDMNIRGAFLHMAADAAVSAGVVIGAVVIMQTGWYWIDPVLSILISVVIIAGTWELLKDSLNLALDAVPEGIDVAQVKEYLTALPGVKEVHDLHVWAMSTTETALTVHIVNSDAKVDDNITSMICRDLHNKFGIGHSTIQIENGSTARNCSNKAI